jgi:hypothetical protein
MQIRTDNDVLQRPALTGILAKPSNFWLCSIRTQITKIFTWETRGTRNNSPYDTNLVNMYSSFSALPKSSSN